MRLNFKFLLRGVYIIIVEKNDNFLYYFKGYKY